MAQRLLISLGGKAALVGGWEDHFYADPETPKKSKQRPNKLGGFSQGLTDTITAKQKEKLDERNKILF